MVSPRHAVARIACFVIGAAGLAACGPQSAAGPRIWIDTPRQGSQVVLGQGIDVQSHAYAPDGVAEVGLFVDGEPYRREPPERPEERFTGVHQIWVPEAAGEHVLHVVAYDIHGQSSAPALVHVIVLPAAEIAEAVITPTFTPTATVTVTPTGTVIPPVEANIWADRLDLLPGECTDLHWEVRYATAVSLDGQPVADQGTRRVCPAGTTTYRFRIDSPSGALDRDLMITVASPSESDPPVISGITESADRIFLPNCQPNTVAISANVTDASGVARVELSYRVVEGSGQGQWRTLTMVASGGRYQATLDWAALDASLHPPVSTGATIEYVIRAWDTRGNAAQSRTLTVEYAYCLI